MDLAAEAPGCLVSEDLDLEAYSLQGLDVFLRRQAEITYSSWCMSSHFSSSRNGEWIALGFASFLSIRKGGSYNDSNDLVLRQGWSLHYWASLSSGSIVTHTLPLHYFTSHSVHHSWEPWNLLLLPALQMGFSFAETADQPYLPLPPNGAQAGRNPIEFLPPPPARTHAYHSHTQTHATYM
jgi:hypothetical protein